jgi:RNA polymerase sigma factor (sigma-70 family)
MADDLVLVHHVIRRRFQWALRRGAEYDALLSAGWEGLERARRRYDASRGRKFSTYAVPRIAGEIRTYLDRAWGLRHKAAIEFVPLDCALSAPAPSEDLLGNVDLERALSRLDPREREALVLFDLNDRPYTEIAERWGRSFGLVGQIRQRAFTRLHSHYGASA